MRNAIGTLVRRGDNRMDELDANYNTGILLKRILNIYASSCKLDTCDLLWGSVTGSYEHGTY